jgi:hypothetical protein
MLRGCELRVKLFGGLMWRSESESASGARDNDKVSYQSSHLRPSSRTAVTRSAVPLSVPGRARASHSDQRPIRLPRCGTCTRAARRNGWTMTVLVRPIRAAAGAPTAAASGTAISSRARSGAISFAGRSTRASTAGSRVGRSHNCDRSTIHSSLGSAIQMSAQMFQSHGAMHHTMTARTVIPRPLQR